MEHNRRTNLQDQKKIETSISSDGDEIIIRSYKCGFCERGFSNAQALGGHMNIHRKDRARLNQEYSSEEMISSTGVYNRDSLQLLSGDHVHERISQKRPLIFLEEDDQESFRRDENDHVSKQVVQLPLFVEKSSSTNSFADGGIEKQSTSDELDLELRLWQEPHD